MLDIDALRSVLAQSAQDDSDEVEKALSPELQAHMTAMFGTFDPDKHPHGPDGKFVHGVGTPVHVPGLKTPWSGGQSDTAAGLNKKMQDINHALLSDDPEKALANLKHNVKVSSHPVNVKYHKYLNEAKGLAKQAKLAKAPPPAAPVIEAKGNIGAYHAKLVGQLQGAKGVEDLNAIKLPVSSPKVIKDYQAALYAHHSNGGVAPPPAVVPPKKLGPLPPLQSTGNDVYGKPIYKLPGDKNLAFVEGSFAHDDVKAVQALHSQGYAAVAAHQPHTVFGETYKEQLLASKAPAKVKFEPDAAPKQFAHYTQHPATKDQASGYFDTEQADLNAIKGLHDAGDLKGLKAYTPEATWSASINHYHQDAIASLKGQGYAPGKNPASHQTAPGITPLESPGYHHILGGHQTAYNHMMNLKVLHDQGDLEGLKAYKFSNPAYPGVGAVGQYKDKALASLQMQQMNAPKVLTPLEHPKTFEDTKHVYEHDPYQNTRPAQLHMEKIKELHDAGDLPGLKAYQDKLFTTPVFAGKASAKLYATHAVNSLEEHYHTPLASHVHVHVDEDTTGQGLAQAVHTKVGALPPKPALPPHPPVNTTYPEDQQKLYLTKVKALQDAYKHPTDPATAINNVPAYSESLQKYKGELLAKVHEWESKKPFTPASVGSTVSTLKVVAHDTSLGPRPDFPAGTHEMFNLQAHAYRQSLPGAQASALNSYQGGGYHELNQKLRNGEATPTKALRLDEVLKNAPPIDRNLRVIRNFGSSLPQGKNAESLVGRVIEDPAFMSTSLHGGFGSGANTSLHLNVPKGTRGLYLNHQGSTSSYEYEVLLPRRTRYRVDHIERHGGTVIIKATVLPPLEQKGLP